MQLYGKRFHSELELAFIQSSKNQMNILSKMATQNERQKILQNQHETAELMMLERLTLSHPSV
jgi:hypothetical protein